MAKRNDIPKVYSVSFPNGKKYIGITTATLDVRKAEHKSRTRHGSSFAIHAALNKYSGLEKWEVLNFCNSFEEAKELEKKYIKELNTMAPKGYNLTYGGDGIKGKKFTEEQRKRLSDAHKGYVMPESQKLAISAANRGVKKSYASKIKRIDAVTGSIKIYESFQDVKKEGFDKGCVYKCAKGERVQHKGYRWELVK